MVDIRPNALPDAILPLRTGDELIVDQGSDGVRKVDPFALADSTAPIATQSEAQVGTDNTKRMTPLRTKQSIASEVGVTLASNAQGAKADSAVQSVNGKTGSSVTIVKGDVGLGNVDNTSDVNKPISIAQQSALDLKANSSVTISAGTGLAGGGDLSADRTVSLNAATIASLDKVDSIYQVNVKQFGAIGDGSNNDFTALSNAIASVDSGTGGELIFPPGDGNYNFSGGLLSISALSPVTIRGMGNVKLSTSQAGTALAVGGGVSSRQGFVRFENLSIWGTDTSGTLLVGIYSVNLMMTSMDFYRSSGDLVSLQECYSFRMNACQLTEGQRSGLYIQKASGNASVVDKCKFLNFSNNGSYGIYMEANDGGSGTGWHYIFGVNNSDFENSYGGLYLNNFYTVVLSDCYFENHSFRAVYVPPGSGNKNFVMRGCDFHYAETVEINDVDTVSIDSCNMGDQCNLIINNCTNIKISGKFHNITLVNCTNVDWGPTSYSGSLTINGGDGKRLFDNFPVWEQFSTQWTATTTNPSIGNGSINMFYKRIGNTVHVMGSVTFGTTTNAGNGIWGFTLPFTSASRGSSNIWMGSASHVGAVSGRNLQSFTTSSTNIMRVGNPDGSNVSNSSPKNWTNGDILRFEITYECA